MKIPQAPIIFSFAGKLGSKDKMMEAHNVSPHQNLVCRHRNEISKEIQQRLKAKVELRVNAYQSVRST